MYAIPFYFSFIYSRLMFHLKTLPFYLMLIVDNILSTIFTLFLWQVKPEANAGSVTVAFLPSLSQLSAISSDGELSFQSVNKVSLMKSLYKVILMKSLNKVILMKSLNKVILMKSLHKVILMKSLNKVILM